MRRNQVIYFQKPENIVENEFKYYEYVSFKDGITKINQSWCLDVKWYGNEHIYHEKLYMMLNDKENPALQLGDMIMSWISKYDNENDELYFYVTNCCGYSDPMKFNVKKDDIVYSKEINTYYKVLDVKNRWKRLKHRFNNNTKNETRNVKIKQIMFNINNNLNNNIEVLETNQVTWKKSKCFQQKYENVDDILVKKYQNDIHVCITFYIFSFS